MSEPRKLVLSDLRELVEAGELAKGSQVFDGKGLAHLSRYDNKLYADAAGSGASPYKVQIIFDDAKVKGRCSCMAARSRPFCKHAAALLVAWSRAPDGFAVADTAPAGVGGDAKKKAVKTSKVDAQALMKNGVEQVATLVRELALSGVASLGLERSEQIQALGTALRENRLRRLSARTIAMGELVGVASSGSDAFDDAVYAELFADMVLTVRKLEKHLEGEVLGPQYVEELIGKTWTKKDRTPIEGLSLIEYSYGSRITPDDYVIRESRFVDVTSGQHYSEKQILPAMLAKRTPPKKSHAGFLLGGAAGSQYPSFAPHRLDIESQGTRETLDASALDKLFDAALPNVTAALTAFQDRKKDVFAPDTLPVAVKVDTVLAEGVRMQVVDATDGALFLPDDARVQEALATALRGGTLEAMFGDVALDGALPTLVPLAVLVRRGGERTLASLGAMDVTAVTNSKKVRARALKQKTGAQRSAWSETARAVGVSAAAIALGEVRDELAQALVAGLGTITARFVEPLAARLEELGLGKQGAALTASAQKADPADRLDDVVKLYQVLGIALTRLSGATHVDRSELVSVPTFESVKVRATDEKLEPREIARRTANGELNRYQAAMRYAQFYDAMPAEVLAEKIYPTWADGAAQPYVARVFASGPELALAASKKVLVGFTGGAGAWRLPRARMARLTAIKVLETLGTKDALELLKTFVQGSPPDAALMSLAQRSMRIVMGKLGQNAGAMDPERQITMDDLVSRLLNAPERGDRQHAALTLARAGFIEALPWIRASFQGDVSWDVREASAQALGQLGDTEALETFVSLLQQRGENGKLGAYALGNLGDVRGIEPLLDAWAEGWQPGIVGDMLQNIGTAALEPLLERIDQQPELVKRKAGLNVLSALDADDVSAALIARIDAAKDLPTLVDSAPRWLTLAASSTKAELAVGAHLVALKPEWAEKAATKEQRAAFKKAKTAATPR